MEKRNITRMDVEKILKENEVQYISLKPFPKSGQKEVFRITCPKESIILKIYNVTPYYSINQTEFYLHGDCDEFELQKREEIRVSTLYINREVNASKKCPIFPRMVITESIKDYVLDEHLYKYYFEELIEGETLDDSRYYNSSNSIKQVAIFLHKALELVKQMWATAYVHRDIKPNNIIIFEDEVKFIDPGLAKSINDENITRTGFTLGTPRYWAPEQREIQSNYIWSFKTDLYPLGLIAIEMYLPEFRKMPTETLKNMQIVFEKWSEKDNSDMAISFFKEVIIKLSSEKIFRRGRSIEELQKILDNYVGGVY